MCRRCSGGRRRCQRRSRDRHISRTPISVTSRPTPHATQGRSDKLVRLDVWLDVACLFKTRSAAQRACRGGKVDVNDQRGKQHRAIQSGDRLAITRPNGRTQHVVVRSLAAQHLPRAMTKGLYDDVTPPPTATELEIRRCVGEPGGPRRRGPGRTTAVATPNTRQRRELRKLKGF